MKEKQFYCVKCRDKVTIKESCDICVKFYKNKKLGKVPALHSYCDSCGTSLNKFIKHSSADDMVEKYGKHY